MGGGERSIGAPRHFSEIRWPFKSALPSRGSLLYVFEATPNAAVPPVAQSRMHHTEVLAINYRHAAVLAVDPGADGHGLRLFRVDSRETSQRRKKRRGHEGRRDHVAVA